MHLRAGPADRLREANRSLKPQDGVRLRSAALAHSAQRRAHLLLSITPTHVRNVHLCRAGSVTIPRLPSPKQSRSLEGAECPFSRGWIGSAGGIQMSWIPGKTSCVKRKNGTLWLPLQSSPAAGARRRTWKKQQQWAVSQSKG